LLLPLPARYQLRYFLVLTCVPRNGTGEMLTEAYHYGLMPGGHAHSVQYLIELLLPVKALKAVRTGKGGSGDVMVAWCGSVTAVTCCAGRPLMPACDAVRWAKSLAACLAGKFSAMR